MILGVGTDIVDVTRIQGALQRTGQRFSERLLAPSELEYFRSLTGGRQVEFMAGRFAVKEAIGKALGIGLGGLRAGEVAVRTTTNGLHVDWFGENVHRPYAKDNWHVSISHTESTAIAFAVWERLQCEETNV